MNIYPKSFFDKMHKDEIVISRKTYKQVIFTLWFAIVACAVSAILTLINNIG